VYTTHTLAAVSNYLTDLIAPYTEWGFAVGSWETLFVDHGMNQRRDPFKTVINLLEINF
jgi:hypothetical protein